MRIIYEAVKSEKEHESNNMVSHNSHDTIVVPAQGAVLSGSIGLSLVGWLRTKRVM